MQAKWEVRGSHGRFNGALHICQSEAWHGDIGGFMSTICTDKGAGPTRSHKWLLMGAIKEVGNEAEEKTVEFTSALTKSTR